MLDKRLDATDSAGEPSIFAKILIGTSLTAESHRFMRSSLAVTRALTAKVHLVHVMPFEPLSFGFDGGFGVDVVASLRSRKEVDLAAEIREAGVLEHEILGADVRVGTPHQVLAESAADIGVDMIIVDATDDHDRERDVLGSTADRLIRSAPCPVLILRTGMPIPPRRVLTPVDFSPTSALALATGVRFLRQLAAKGSSAIESLFVLSEITRQLDSRFSPQHVDRMAKEELLRFTLEHTSEWPGTIETKLRIGDARRQLQRELEQQPFDLVVVGSHGHGLLHRALIGSVAGQLARQANCSVLFVPHATDVPMSPSLAVESRHLGSPDREIESRATETELRARPH